MNRLILSLLVVAYVILMATSISGAKNVVHDHDEVPRALPLDSGAKSRRAENWHKSEERGVVNRNKRASDETATNNGAGSDLLSSVSAGGGTAGVSAAAVGVGVGAAGGSGGKRGKNKKNNKSPTDIGAAGSSSQQGAGIGIYPKRPAKGKTHTHQRQQQQQRLRDKSLPKSRPQSSYTQNAKNTKKDTTKVLDSTKIPASCRYSKSAWTECDTKSNTRSRTLTLKKGDKKCDPTKTIARKCKKACRYEKGSWSECLNGQMSRTDNLKSTSDTTCKSTRSINKNCNPSKSKDKKDRKKAARKGRA